MSETSTSTVGRAAIDAYLDSVELALIDADAPRIDRLQVLQELEAQIADMLAQQATPLTEESVRAVLDKLEPPSHFAATYGSGSRATAPKAGRIASFKRRRWPLIAAGSAAVLALGGLFGLLAAGSGPNDLLIWLALLFGLVGLAVTPFAIRKAYHQLRAEPGTSRQRDLVLLSTVVYGLVAPLLILTVAAEVTDGGALVAVGIAAFFYCQYSIVRRLWRYMSDALPPQSAAPTSNSNGNRASSPVSAATPMPAV